MRYIIVFVGTRIIRQKRELEADFPASPPAAREYAKAILF